MDMPHTEQLTKSTNSTLEYSDIHLSILRSIAYSDVFNYPLKSDEIHGSMELQCSMSQLQHATQELVNDGLILKVGDFYCLRDKKDNLKLRLERNNRAVKYLKWARRISTFIGLFPFVRGVLISGSLSKNSMDEDSDIDYFVITESGHLWTCRTILMVFKKVFLFNSYKLFCLNYFVDTNNLKIKDENIYVANEINTLIPTYGKKYCKEFFQTNEWATDLQPNRQKFDVSACRKHKRGSLKWLVEQVFSGRFGRWMEKKCMNLSKSYWKRKFKHLKGDDLIKASVSKEGISSHHPENFKDIVLNRQAAILKELELKFDLKF